MAIRKPLVMVSGQIQQLQAGDSISIPESVNYQADAAMVAGNVVYASAAGHVGLAKADAVGTSKVTGLAVASISSGSSGAVQNGGIVSLSTALWDAIAGTTGGLTYNTIYYLSAATAGALTSTPPSTAGQYVVPVGIAQSTTDLLLYNNASSVLL